jgi:hypothetical protein
MAEIDPTLIGETAAELMDEFDIEGEIEIVLIIAAIKPHDEDEHGESYIKMKCSDERGYVQAGLLRSAAVITELGWERADGSD